MAGAARKAPALGLLLAAAPRAGCAGEYVELRGARCWEIEGEYPLGGPGEAWSEELLDSSRALCDAAGASCWGLMRYVGTGQDPGEHCRDWCGRPQFCGPTAQGALGAGLASNAAWVSYVKAEYLPALGVPHGATPGSRGPPDAGGPSAVLDEGELAREVPCGDFSARPWDGPQVVLLAAVPAASAAGPRAPAGACRVAYRPFGAAAGAEGPEQDVDGVLAEDTEPGVLPVFSAFLNHTGWGARASDAAPWTYHVGPPHDFPVSRLGPQGEKRHVMSVYFLSASSSCPGQGGVPLFPADAALQLGSEHVHVEDGTHATREAAFKHYHFTLLCGDFTGEPFPPQAFVYSLAYAASALVPEFMHWKASRQFYHLPDAAQGYKTLYIEGLEAFFTDMLTNPAKEQLLEFKHTFLLLSQQLFWYKYREPARRRADIAACALCDAQERARRRSAALQGAAPRPEGGASTAAAARGLGQQPADGAVAVVFCGMSRRSAHELRQVLRDTWARAIADAAPAVVQRFFVGRAEGVPLEDGLRGDVVELPVPESYRALNIKAFSMLSWAYHAFPNLQWLVRHDDDVYLRAPALLAQLAARPPVRYFWGMIDHGSAPVRDPGHQHYNSYEQFPEQRHPAWGDIFPPYARGLLWAMSVDLLAAVVAEFQEDVPPGSRLDEVAANQIAHPDDPSLGVVVRALVAKRGMSINLDDRDFNSFSLNPSCSSKFSSMHNRTWVVHHVKAETMHCMWNLDQAAAASARPGNSAADASQREFPDLCLCATEVDEEEDMDPDGLPFWYDKTRFNTAR